MPGLSLNLTGDDPTPTVLSQQVSGSLVHVSLTSGDWSLYTINAGAGDGWALYGPAHHPLPLALSGSATVKENKTFTPKVAGRYVVVLNARLASDDSAVRLTALYEVKSAYCEQSILTPQERDEYETNTGWARSIESHLQLLTRQLGGRRLAAVKYVGGSAIAANRVVRLTGSSNFSASGLNASQQRDYLSEVVLTANTTNSDSETVETELLGLTLTAMSPDDTGYVLLDGLIPGDFSAWDDADYLLVNSTGALTHRAGTYARVCGKVLRAAAGTVGTESGGLAWFDGVSTFTPPKEIYGSPVRITGHGFALGDAIRFDGNSNAWVASLADTPDNAEVFGIVVWKNTDTVWLSNGGRIKNLNTATIVPGAGHFLSDEFPGLITALAPTTIGHVRKPLLVADSDTSGWIQIGLGVTIVE